MSASSLPLPFLVKGSVTRNDIAASIPPVCPVELVRRRPDMQQGRALEMLGHAVEYLVDSRMFLVNEPYTTAEVAALQLLSRSSRELFANCAEVVPVSRRLKEWAYERLRHGGLKPVVSALDGKG